MPTFKSKPVEPEIVDARKYTGTQESAREISEWFKANYEGEYLSATLREQVSVAPLGSGEFKNAPVNEFILMCKEDTYGLYPDTWLVHKQNGSWITYSDRYIKRKYDQV
jgi:hypothetical protein